MTDDTVKIVKVFIGSPGGLADERQAAKRIVEEINQSHSEHWGCQIKLVGWELTLPGYNRAQSLINQDLDKCQYFVGVLWNHWGSKPDSGNSKYTSGFHEEFKRAEAHFETGSIKDIFLFFKEIPEIQMRDLGPSVRKVIDFRDECVRRKKPLFKQFKESVDFDAVFRSTIEQIGWRESTILAVQLGQSSEAEQPSVGGGSKPGEQDIEGGLLGNLPAKFVMELSRKSSEWQETSSFEIARLRMIAFSVSRSGNDELYLGNHDANIIFLNRHATEFSNKEKRVLLDTGVVGFEHQNVPLWYWIANSDPPHGSIERLNVLSIVGNSLEKRNAIRILQRLGRGTPSLDNFFTRQQVIARWLGRDEPSLDVSTALDFIATNGDESDIEIVEELIDDIMPGSRSAAISAIIQVLTRLNPGSSFEKLITLNPDSLPDHVVRIMFSHPASISTELLSRLIGVKADAVRRHAATSLNSRQAFTMEAAEKLLTDSDFETRLIAVEAMASIGRPLEDQTVRVALRKPKAGGLLSLSNRTPSTWDDTLLETYKRNQLLRRGSEKLLQMVDECGIYDHLEISALYRGFPSRAISHIRANLSDGFKSHFDERMKEFSSRHGGDSKLVADTLKLRDYLCNRLSTEALDAIAGYGDVSDLQLVRKTLDNIDVDFSEKPLIYLGRFGDWSDVDRIIKTNNRYLPGFVYFGSDDRTRLIGKALHSVGRHRIIDLLGRDLEIDIRREFFRFLSQKEVRALTNEVIIEILGNKDDQYRKIVCLRCVQSFDRSRLKKLLLDYTENDRHRYYNCVHWLGLGVAMPREATRSVLNFELA